MNVLSNNNKDKAEINAIAGKEAELRVLQHVIDRSYKSRRLNRDDVNHLLKGFNREIARLKAEHEALTEQVKLASTTTSTRRNEEMCYKLKNMVVNYDWVNKNILDTRLELKKIDNQLKTMRQHLYALKLKHISTSGDSYKEKCSRKHEVLDKKISIYLGRYNDITKLTNKLREQIAILRMERYNYDKYFLKLNLMRKDFDSPIRRMQDSTASALDSREDAVLRFKTLSERNKRETVQHLTEMKEQTRRIDHLKRMQQFMQAKNKVRLQDHEFILWKSKLADIAQARKAERRASFRKNEAVYYRLKELTGPSLSSQEIVSWFKRAEDRNMSRFFYVKQLSSTLVQLRGEERIISKRLAEYNRRLNLKLSKQRQDIQNLSEAIKKAEKFNDSIEQVLHSHSKFFSDIAKGVSQFLKITKTIDDRVDRRLDFVREPESYNVMKFMESLVENLTDCLLVHREKVFDSSEDSDNSTESIKSSQE